jgi:hypothetical protein
MAIANILFRCLCNGQDIAELFEKNVITETLTLLIMGDIF